MVEYVPSNCFIKRFRAAVSVLVGPWCPALLICIGVGVHCCIGQIKWRRWWRRCWVMMCAGISQTDGPYVGLYRVPKRNDATCLCTKGYGGEGPSDECRQPCPGNRNQICGGGNSVTYLHTFLGRYTCRQHQLVCVESRTSALNMTLSAVELWRRRRIGWYRPPPPELQLTSCTSLRLSIDGTDRQRADRRTDAAPLHRRSPLETGIVSILWH